MGDITIRPAVSADLGDLGRLAGELVRLHHAADPARFFLVDRVEEGYSWWFSRELSNAESVILVANDAAKVVGYAYGALEERNWNLLLDAHGAVHDLFVEPTERRAGVGRKLMNALVTELEKKGASRIVLSTMVSNTSAQHLFEGCGFRPTMLEMIRG
jgi:ribosomal protein S18 acetylase RimI-like enzyme